MRIPWRENFDPNTFYAHIPEKEKFDQQVQTYWYQVRRGDNLRAISRRFQTSINSLMALNEIRDPNQIYVGQVLKIPTREKGRASSTYLAAAGKGGSTISGGTDAVTSHQTPIRGDKPATSASSDDLVVHLGPAEEEQEIIIAPPEPFSDWITVQADETLGHFADWLEIPTQQLRRLNRLRYGQDIHIGQRIKLTYVNVPPEEFNRRRMEYHKGIEEDFFNTYKVEGVQVHQIKRGENIWYLCNQVYEIPYWLVMKYNSSIDLENLKTGDKLIIPVVALNDSKNSES